MSTWGNLSPCRECGYLHGQKTHICRPAMFVPPTSDSQLKPWECPWGICEIDDAQKCRALNGNTKRTRGCGAMFAPGTTTEQAKAQIRDLTGVAYVAPEPTRPEPDCRTCNYFHQPGDSPIAGCISHGPCWDADKYQALPPVRLYRKEVPCPRQEQL